MELLERFEALPKVPPEVRFVQLEIRKLQTYWDEKCELLLEMLRDEPEAFEHPGNYGHLVWFPSELAELGLTDAAEAWYERVEKIPAEGWAAVLRGWFVNEYLYKVGRKNDDLETGLAEIAGMTDEQVLDSDTDAAYLLAEAGEYDRAIRLAEARQMIRLDSTFWVERRPAPRLLLAGLYQAAGRSADADVLLRDIVDDLEGEYEVGIRHPQTLEYLATAYAMQGRPDRALAMYRKAVDYHLRRTDLPDWPPPVSPWEQLREDPRFVMQWDRMQADLLQQGERIRTMLARYDIDELLGPAIALAEQGAASTTNP